MTNKRLLSVILLIILNFGLLEAQSISEFRTRQCLNGWWDFNPVMTPEGNILIYPEKPRSGMAERRHDCSRIVEKARFKIKRWI